MLLVGYCYGIHSERRLCEEIHLNVAYRWFCRLGLDGEVPDHSTFSKNRHGRFPFRSALVVSTALTPLMEKRSIWSAPKDRHDCDTEKNYCAVRCTNRRERCKVIN
jgi:transposase